MGRLAQVVLQTHDTWNCNFVRDSFDRFSDDCVDVVKGIIALLRAVLYQVSQDAYHCYRAYDCAACFQSYPGRVESRHPVMASLA